LRIESEVNIPSQAPSVLSFHRCSRFGSFGVVILDVLSFICRVSFGSNHRIHTTLTDDNPQPLHVKQRTSGFLLVDISFDDLEGILVRARRGFGGWLVWNHRSMFRGQGLESGDDDIIFLK